jgi:mono/diheme cytochrome c family protein
LRFEPLDGRLPPSELALDELADGEYSAQGANLSLPADWRVRAVVRRTDRFDAFADFPVDLTPVDRRAVWSRAAWMSLVLVAAAYLFAQLRLVGRRSAFLGYGLLPALALALAGFSLAARPAPVDAGDRINPIPPTSGSVARGAELYQIQCAACHGASGRGDGPVGLTLRPPPADLSQHAVPGVHSDGQLFEWISRGYPGSVMPAFEDRLSDEDRWHLVNFIRTLAPQ